MSKKIIPLAKEDILEILAGYLGKVTESRLYDTRPEGAVYYMKTPVDEDTLWFYRADGWDKGLVTKFAVRGSRLIVVDGVSGEILFDGVSGD